MTIVHRRNEGRAVTSDREREISPTVWIRCELREVIGATQDHVFDDERSPLRELDLLVEQQRAVGGRVASPRTMPTPDGDANSRSLHVRTDVRYHSAHPVARSGSACYR
eukprot:COSAG01_NODE_1271_length_10961_cov_555.935739_9_plen_109_part_00